MVTVSTNQGSGTPASEHVALHCTSDAGGCAQGFIQSVPPAQQENSSLGISASYCCGMKVAPWLKDDGTYRCFYCEVGKTGAGKQRDADEADKQLKESHLALWSRPLPNGDSWAFDSPPGWYMRSVVQLPTGPAEWCAGSDNFATTHTNALPELASEIPGYADGHLHQFCTIGGYIVFPAALGDKRPTGQPARRWTLNQAKGCDGHVADRMDLTLESIRLYYAGVTSREANALGDVVDAYGWFFDPFGKGAEGFQAYVDYFFLTPFVEDGRVVPLYRGSLDFGGALPRDPSGYYPYIESQREAVQNRNALITQWWEQDSVRP